VTPPPKEGFQVPFFLFFTDGLADIGEVGLNQLLCVDWHLAYHVVSLEAGLSDLTQRFGNELSACLQGPSDF